jgi:hypothetical protein
MTLEELENECSKMQTGETKEFALDEKPDLGALTGIARKLDKGRRTNYFLITHTPTGAKAECLQLKA